MGLGLKSLAEVCFFGRERVVRAADADSAGARGVSSAFRRSAKSACAWATASGHASLFFSAFH
ncbi:hypothetical protein ACGFY3_42560 [Streptomyces mirabilis]|uniref:hypothetical protein n=1 Tax=Streptomyces mirabilis TaxID=68239 RepID=UPI00371F4004